MHKFQILNNLIMAKIQLNGKKVDIKSNLSLFDLLKKYKLTNKKIAIEFNGEIISKINYKKKNLKNNDRIEIVHFIGGG
jgi:sulfur carrier protein